MLQDFEWLEYYAGRAACTTAMRRAGYVAAKFDLLYFDRDKTKRCGKNSNYYDLLTPAGFALLGKNLEFLIAYRCLDTSTPAKAFGTPIFLVSTRVAHTTFHCSSCQAWCGLRHEGQSREFPVLVWHQVFDLGEH